MKLRMLSSGFILLMLLVVLSACSPERATSTQAIKPVPQLNPIPEVETPAPTATKVETVPLMDPIYLDVKAEYGCFRENGVFDTRPEPCMSYMTQGNKVTIQSSLPFTVTHRQFTEKSVENKIEGLVVRINEAVRINIGGRSCPVPATFGEVKVIEGRYNCTGSEGLLLVNQK